MKITSLCLSNSPQGINRKLLANVSNHIDANLIALSNMNFPMFCIDEPTPENLKDLSETIIQSDAIMISSPEFNASFSAYGKNVLDWISTQGHFDGHKKFTPLTGKPVFIMSAAPGPLGGIRCLPEISRIVSELGGVVVKSFATTGGFNDDFDYTCVFATADDFKEWVDQ